MMVDKYIVKIKRIINDVEWNSRKASQFQAGNRFQI